ncbi:MAG: T9SS type A sorting domain-containing protein [Bacteroidetes bacterium]|nr:T9SS type A sorting domain-containing protein [Bacteroidota bacterium]
MSLQHSLSLHLHHNGYIERCVQQIAFYFPESFYRIIRIGGVSSDAIVLTTTTDMKGRIVSETKNATEIDLSSVANGLYMVRIQTAGHVSIKKINIVR